MVKRENLQAGNRANWICQNRCESNGYRCLVSIQPDMLGIIHEGARANDQLPPKGALYALYNVFIRTYLP